VQAGDTLILVCDGKKITKRVHKVTHFKTITALLKKYNSELINPGVTELKEMKNMYYSYPGYQEKIAQFGILAFELE
jgi:ASC-1-like (ASCH) protein